MTEKTYVLAGQDSELDRLQLQARVWEPAGRQLLNEIGERRGARALDVGCGAMGWLRLLSEWVGTDGEVVGTDIDDGMLSAADRFVSTEGLRNVALIKDDLFASDLDPESFDLVHARFQMSPLGRAQEQMENYLRLVRPGGFLVVEDLDVGSWHFNPPPTPAVDELILRLKEFFEQWGDPHVGRRLPDLFRSFGIEASVRADVQALPPGHPYLSLPLQFATGLEKPLQSIVGADKLEELREAAKEELEQPGRWGTTFTLLQAWGQRKS